MEEEYALSTSILASSSNDDLQRRSLFSPSCGSDDVSTTEMKEGAHPPLPQVTVSHEVGGSLVEYHNFSDTAFIQERRQQQQDLQQQQYPSCCLNKCREQEDATTMGGTTVPPRSIRSHSLTPSIGYQQSLDAVWGGGLPPKMRSHSITFGAKDENKADRDMEGEFVAPEGSGMRDLRDWMKSLRLHKYTDRLLAFSYEELLSMTESDLQKLMFTDGAKGKFLKQISLIKERPHKIKELKQQLEEITELKDLLTVLPELEKLILMPLKPTQQKPVLQTKLTMSSVAVSSLCRQERRHDSGSDSGTEMVEEMDDLPQETFDLLEKTFSIIICKQHDDCDRDRVVLHFFRLLERRCLRKEGFSSQQKQWFLTWLKRMDQVWDISKTTVDCAGLDAKRKFDRKSPRDLLLRRSSLQPPLAGAMGHFPRGPSPFSAAQSSFFGGSGGGGGGGGGQPFAMTSGPCLTLFQDRHPDMSGGTSGTVQRRSVPDINPPNLCPQVKRNSYQGDHRMPPLVDSEVLSNVFDYHQHQQRGLGGLCGGNFLMHSPSATSSFSSSSCSRRASTLSMSSWDSGFSRRSSTMSSCGGDGNSRRNSSISEDNGSGFLSDRRDSSNLLGCMDSSAAAAGGAFLSVDSARKGSFCCRLNPPPGGGGSSVSSGCASADEGSTDSLEHDLHKLSLAVTEQALLE